MTATRPTFVPNLSLITAEADLAGAEIELVGLERREFRLRNALAPLRAPTSPFSFVLIDCPPSLGLLTLNGLVAADAVLVPLQCEFYALEGITGLVRTIEMVKRGLNPSLRLQGNRADHVRSPQQPVGSGCGRCPRVLWRDGL